MFLLLFLPLVLSSNSTSGWTRLFPAPHAQAIVSAKPEYGPLRLFTSTSHPGSRQRASSWSAPFRILLGLGSSSLYHHPDFDVPDDVVIQTIPWGCFSDLWEFNLDYGMWRQIAGPKGPGPGHSVYDSEVLPTQFSTSHLPLGRSDAVSWIGNEFSSDGIGGTILLWGGYSVYNASLTKSDVIFEKGVPVEILVTSPSYASHNDLWEFDVTTYSWREIFAQNDFIELEHSSFSSSGIPFLAPHYAHYTRGEYYPDLQPPPLSDPCTASSHEFPHLKFLYGGTVYLPHDEILPSPSNRVSSNMLFQFDSTSYQFRLLHNGTCPDPIKAAIQQSDGPLLEQCMFDMPLRIPGHTHWLQHTNPMTNITEGIYSDFVAPSVSFVTPPFRPSCWATQDLFFTFSGDLSNHLWAHNSTRLQWARISSLSSIDGILHVEELGKFNVNNTVSGRKMALFWQINSPSASGVFDNNPLFLVFGGLTYVQHNRVHTDPLVWIYSPLLNQWKAINSTLNDESTGPFDLHKRWFMTSAMTRTNRLVVFGGRPDAGEQVHVDLWSFDPFRSHCGEHAVFDNSTGTPYCNCSLGYSGESCDYWECYDISSREYEDVCSGRGICANPDRCQCFPDAEGDECETYMCGDFDSGDSEVCSSNGNCVQLHTCSCSANSYGELCAETIGPKGFVHSSEEREWIEVRYLLSNPSELLTLYVGGCEQIIANSDDLGLSPRCVLDGSNLEIYLTSHWNWTITSLHILPLTSKAELTDVERKVIISLVPHIPLYISPLTAAMIVGIVFGGIVAVLVVVCLITATTAICYSAKKVNKQDEIVKYFELETKTLHSLRSGSGRLTVRQLADSTMEIDYSELDVKEVIGRGGSNSVIFKAAYAGQTVAFKCFRMADLAGDEDFLEFEKEVTILASIRHPNVLRFFGVSLAQNRIGLVMEFCSNGDIKSYYSSNEVAFEDKLRMIIEITSALSYLHDKEIIHRDMKSENVLLDDNLITKLIDFGVSRAFAKEDEAMTQRVGTSVYMAPEVVQASKYTSAVDTYSLAIMIYEMLTDNFVPYGQQNSTFNIEYRVALDPAFRPDISALASSLAESEHWIIPLVQMMWSHNHEIRPTMSELFSALNRRSATGVAVDVDASTLRQRRERIRSRRLNLTRMGEMSVSLGSSESLENLADMVRVADEAQAEASSSLSVSTTSSDLIVVESTSPTSPESPPVMSETSDPFGIDEEEEEEAAGERIFTPDPDATNEEFERYYAAFSNSGTNSSRTLQPVSRTERLSLDRERPRSLGIVTRQIEEEELEEVSPGSPIRGDRHDPFEESEDDEQQEEERILTPDADDAPSEDLAAYYAAYAQAQAQAQGRGYDYEAYYAAYQAQSEGENGNVE